MGLYHLSVKYVSRRQGRSAVASAAYRSGERLHNLYDGLTHDFRKKRGVVHTEIILPLNAPPEFSDRETLWNSVELAEKRYDARTAREVEIGLPNELDRREQIELVRNYANDAFVSLGMCADIAIHDVHRDALETDNPHAHILLTTRSVGQAGFGKKIEIGTKKMLCTLGAHSGQKRKIKNSKEKVWK